MTIEEKNIPVKVEYYFDQYLMHLLQEITKRPSVEIIAFFYELGSQVADIGAKEKLKSKGYSRGMNKHIVDYFPGTSVPFSMKVKGYRRHDNSYDRATNKWIDKGEAYMCTAEVGFPEGRTYISEQELKDISTALMERALLDAPLDGVKVPDFKKPVIRSPKMFKKLMDAFAGREPEPKKPRKRKNAAHVS